MRAVISFSSARLRCSTARRKRRFQIRMTMRTASSVPTTDIVRDGVHHEGREMTRMSSGMRTTSAKPLMRGKTAFGRQFSVSITHTPETSMP